jgi:hypothetical protein
MTGRTQAVLNWAEKLEDDLQRRDAELAAFKILIARADEGTVRHQALLRALWVMLYAHYEGYCKFALQIYLDALMQRKLPRIDYKDPIIAFSMQGKFRRLSNNLSNDNCVRFIQQFPVDLNNPVEFDEKAFESHGNFIPDLLKRNCRSVGLSYNQVEANRLHLGNLVDRRNHIAHGKLLPIKNFQEYQDCENATFDVMLGLAVTVIEALEQEQYLKTHP